MRGRVGLLIVLLGIKVIWNIFEASQFHNGETLKINGEINKMERNISKCNIFIDKFLFEYQGYCKFSQRQQIMVIGSVKRGLINDLMGNIELSNALIDSKNVLDPLSVTEPVIISWLGNWREKVVDIYKRHLPTKEAALVAGIVLGDKESISGDFYEQMVKSGTVHVAVASGFNLMILSGSLMTWLFWFLKRSWAVVFGVVIAALYTLMAGGEPPVVRAWVMVVMLLIGSVIGRGQSSWWALMLTAWVMVMAEIGLLKSASFQLSVMASVGLMMVEPMIMRYFESQESVLIHFFSRLGVTTSLATMLTTGPVIWWHFGRLGLMGVLSNVLVLPLVPMVMLLGALMIPLGGLVSWPLYALSHIVVRVIEWLG